jgi:nucleotide-binding universal stress UspA family protein
MSEGEVMSTNQGGLVVVGVDGSPDSLAALKWADHYASATGASLRLVTSWEWAMAYGAPMMFDGYHPNADATVVIEKAKAELTLSEDRVEVRVEEGAAGPVLVRESAGAQALVVGTQGHSAVSKVLLGSVSAYCVHHGSCPIVVVR